MAVVSPSTTLHEEQSLMRQLLTLVKQEQQQLVHADLDSLSAGTVSKAQLVTQMTLLSRQRHQALGQAGFAARDAGMEPWLAHSGDGAASADWQQLLDLTREAKEINRVNGILINKQMAHTQGALNAIRHPLQDNSSTYGPSGHATGGATTRRYVVG